MTAALALSALVQPWFPALATWESDAAVAALGLLAATAWAAIALERGDWSFIGLDHQSARPRLWVRPAVMAACAIGIPSLVLIAIGAFRVAPAPDRSWFATAGLAAGVLALPALGEELLVHGYFFALFRERWGWKAAVVASSAAFGVLHAWNPGVGAQAILTVTLAGLFLGLVIVWTGSLYAAWAAHLSWNWTLAALLHADVSGIGSVPPADYRVVDAGADWLTGGRWGPEGGAAAAAGLTVATILVLRAVLLRGERTNG